jgi:hypothetical protein
MEHSKNRNTPSDAEKLSGKKPASPVEMNASLVKYNTRNWNWFSCDLSWDATHINYDKVEKKKVVGYGKKVPRFPGGSWKEPSTRQKDPNATGYGLICGEENDIVVIDIDNPDLEHNKRLMELCDEVANCVAQTKKGKHYVFKYTPELAKTHNFSSLEFDLKSNGGFIFVEPSRYTTHENKTVKYKWLLFPSDDEPLAEVPRSVIEFIYECLKPKEPTKKTEKTRKDRENDKISKAVDEMGLEVKDSDVREALMSVSEERANNYEDWIHALFALKNANLPYELFEEFSMRSPKANDGSPFYMWNAVKKSDCDTKITTKTIWWWLKNDNPEKFLELCALKDEYQQMKVEFEANTCLVGATIWTIYPDGTRTQQSVADAKIKYLNKRVKVWDEEKQKNIYIPFFNNWLCDPNRRDYDRIGFYPNKEKCPPRVYNLFTGFKAEEYKCEVPTTKAELEEIIEPILTHINLLTNGEDKNGFFLKWLANIVKDPDNKSDIGILFRAVGKFLAEGGGEGKNIFFEWFGYKVLGDKYYLGIADNANLYDAFNSMFEGILLCFIDEATGRDNHTQSDKLKAKITSRKTLINRKNMPQYVISDYCRYAFASNNFNPLRVGAGDRRFSAFDVSAEKRNNIAYFENLSKAMSDERVALAFYQYLLRYVDTYSSPVHFQRNRPITKAYVSLRQANAPLITKWIVDKLRKGKLTDGYVSRLFANFEKWCMETKEKMDGEKTMTLTAFGRLLSDNTNLMRLDDEASDDEVVRMGDKTADYKGSKFFRWNYRSLVEHLEHLHLLEKDELKLKEDGTPVCMIDAQPQPDRRPVEEEE